MDRNKTSLATEWQDDGRSQRAADWRSHREVVPDPRGNRGAALCAERWSIGCSRGSLTCDASGCLVVASEGLAVPDFFSLNASGQLSKQDPQKPVGGKTLRSHKVRAARVSGSREALVGHCCASVGRTPSALTRKASSETGGEAMLRDLSGCIDMVS